MRLLSSCHSQSWQLHFKTSVWFKDFFCQRQWCGLSVCHENLLPRLACWAQTFQWGKGEKKQCVNANCCDCHISGRMDWSYLHHSNPVCDMHIYLPSWKATLGLYIQYSICVAIWEKEMRTSGRGVRCDRWDPLGDECVPSTGDGGAGGWAYSGCFHNHYCMKVSKKGV